AEAKEVLTAAEVRGLQRLVRTMPVGEQTLEAILDIVRLARPEDSPLKEIREGLAWGPGPRAGQALMLGVRARALLNGRLAPSTEDVVELAGPVLKHRIALSFGARADGVTAGSLIARLVREIS